MIKVAVLGYGTVGSGVVEVLNTNGASIAKRAGDVQIENIDVTQQIEINGGVGKTDLKSCKIKNLQANLGMGEFTFYGEITGKNTISSGIGEVKLNSKTINSFPAYISKKNERPLNLPSAKNW